MDNQRKNGSRRGMAIVETAIIMPLLLLLTFGGIKYGWLFIKWQQLTNVARHTVRYAVTYPTPTDPTPSTLIDTLMKKDGMPTYTVNELTSGAKKGEPVTVEIEVLVPNIDIFNMPVLLPAPPRLKARMTMSQEGPNSSSG